MKFNIRLYSLILLIIAIGCNDPENPEEFQPPVCTDTYTPKNFSHQVVGFYPHYRHDSPAPSSIKWNRLTRVIYTFAIPDSNGNLAVGDLSKASELVDEGHANGVEVWFSVGGGGAGSNAFPQAISSKLSRKNLIEDILVYLGNNCFDGVDIDYEKFEVSGIDSNFLAFMEELYDALKPYGYKISLDVYAGNWGGQHVADGVLDQVDFFNIMAYDFTGPWNPSNIGPHSSFDQAIGSGSTSSSTGIAYWESYRGWDKEKLLLGVPFYGRDFDNSGNALTYLQILDMDPAAANVSQWNNIYYNGFDLIDAKAQHVVNNNYPGIMIWEIGQDSQDPDYSLLDRIGGHLN